MRSVSKGLIERFICNEKKVAQILEVVKQLLFSKELFKIGKFKAENFSRNRVLSFNKVTLFIINLIRKSLQLELNNFTNINGLKDVTKQAFSKARRKLNPIVFKLLNNKLVSEFYTNNEFLWHKPLHCLIL